MKEPGKKKTKILKIILIAILCYILFAVLCFVVFIVAGNCGGAYEIQESGYFKYLTDRDDEVAIIGFTPSGQEQETLEIPRKIDGKPVKYIGYRDYDNSGLMAAQYYRLESENLKKLYVYDNIYYIEEDAFADIPEVCLMWCSNTSEVFSHSDISDFTRIFVYEPVYESLGEKEPSIFAIANIVFMNNYSDEVNGGYYRLDNVEEDEKIPEPPDPEREGYKFTGWYTESECENLWSFNESPVIEEGEEFRLYAGWHKS